MTICIAALCDGGKQAVVAADKMTVVGEGALQVVRDDDANKIISWGDTTALLYSGSINEPQYVLDEMNRARDEVPQDVAGIAKHVSELATSWLSGFRDGLVKNRLGNEQNYQEVVTLVASQAAGPIFEAWHEASKFTPGSFLIVGFSIGDSQADGVIYEVNGASIAKLQLRQHAVIGSGRIYAGSVLDSVKYSQNASVAEAVYHVFCAKKAAENIYGVGKTTVLAVLSPDKSFQIIESPEVFARLEVIRTRKMSLNEEEQIEVLTSLSLPASD